MMNKLKIREIRKRSALYYAVGIGVFSSFLIALVVLVELAVRNS